MTPKKNKKKLYLGVIIFISMIIVINLIGYKSEEAKRIYTETYFENFDLELKGVICNIEEQTDSHKYLVSLNTIESNYKNYGKTNSLQAIFCLKKDKYAVFADHTDKYEIGDTIIIGENKFDLIKCISKNGDLKFVKKRKETLLYTVAPPNERMKKLIDIGCK